MKTVNGADGISDIEGKVARVSGEGVGKRPSFKICGQNAAGRSWLCLEIPGRDNVRRAFCFLYEMEPDVHVTLLGELGFANQFGMNS